MHLIVFLRLASDFGRLDDSVLYSITDHDWPAIKQQLEARFSG